MNPGQIISTILKHDSKVTSYKIALLRAINDVVLSFPDMRSHHQDVAVPLRVLAEFWLAYYWPFVDPAAPILQGPRAVREGVLRSDMAFRAALTDFRQQWEQTWSGLSNPADGYVVRGELRIARRRRQYSRELLDSYDATLRQIARTIEMPVRYAGPGEWSVFSRPVRLDQLRNVVPLPGTGSAELCLVVTSDLWNTFRELSLWVESLCIHEWSLFTERVQQEAGAGIDRGTAYVFLTARPDNRRPLTWERNHIDLLLMEGCEFTCPWTERRITRTVSYDLDHLVPVSVYPINELWNLVPADPAFNSWQKRDRLPSDERLQRAQPHLAAAYNTYQVSPALGQAMRDDVGTRFSVAPVTGFADGVAHAVVDFIAALSSSRNLARF